MTKPTTDSPVELVPKTQAPLPKTLIGLIVAVIILLAILGWLAPVYKKVVKDAEQKQKTIEDQAKEIEGWKVKSLQRETFFPGGGLRSRTTLAESSGTRERTDSHSLTETDNKTHETITTKRGLVSIGALWSDKGFRPVGGCVQATVFGPFNALIVGYYDPFTIYPGISFSF